MQIAYESLGIANFRLFLLTRLLMVAAFEVQITVIGWQLYAITKDPFSLGLIGLAHIVPYIAVSLFSGYFADTYNRKKLSLLFMFIVTAVSVAFWHFEQSLSVTAAFHLPFLLYGVVFAMGAIRGFLQPALSALMPQLIPRTLYTNASSWNSNTWHLAAIGGPALGGLIYGFGGTYWAYSTVWILLGLAIISLFSIKYQSVVDKSLGEPILQSLREGMQFVSNHKIMLGALSLDMFAVLFGGAVALIPVFAKDVLLVGPESFGFLRSSPFVGSVLMGLYLAHHPPIDESGKKLLWAVAGFGVSTILFALSTNFYLSMLLLAIGGAFDNISVVIRGSIVQLVTPEQMRGRVSAFNNIFIGVSNELGAFESGLAARLLGLIPSVLFGGSMTLLVVGLYYSFLPAFRELSLRQLAEEDPNKIN